MRVTEGNTVLLSDRGIKVIMYWCLEDGVLEQSYEVTFNGMAEGFDCLEKAIERFHKAEVEHFKVELTVDMVRYLRYIMKKCDLGWEEDKKILWPGRTNVFWDRVATKLLELEAEMGVFLNED